MMKQLYYQMIYYKMKLTSYFTIWIDSERNPIHNNICHIIVT